MSIPHRGTLSAVSKDYVRRLVATDSAVEGQLGVEYIFTVPDAATSDIDIVVNEKIEIVDVVCVKRNGAGAGNTMQIKKAAATVSDAIACAVDDAITRAASITDAAGVNILVAGDTLRLTASRAAGTRDCLVRVICLLRA